MTLPRMLAVVGLRLAVLVGGLLALSFPAKWLRPWLYPDGLNGWMFMIVFMAILMAALYIFFMWVLDPAWKWWDAFKTEREEMIERLRK